MKVLGHDFTVFWAPGNSDALKAGILGIHGQLLAISFCHAQGDRMGPAHVKLLAAHRRTIKVGHPLATDTLMGPLVSEAVRRCTTRAVWVSTDVSRACALVVTTWL